MNQTGTTKIVNFMTPGTGVLVLGCGYISHKVKMLSSSLLLSIDKINYDYSNYDQERVDHTCKFHDPKDT